MESLNAFNLTCRSITQRKLFLLTPLLAWNLVLQLEDSDTTQP